MKKLLLGAVAAVGLALSLAPEASAYWATRRVCRYDPHLCHTVCRTERYWVPDCDDDHHHHHGRRYDGYDRYRRDYDRDGFPDRAYYPAFPYRR